jgi:hypothetical protein
MLGLLKKTKKILKIYFLERLFFLAYNFFLYYFGRRTFPNISKCWPTETRVLAVTAPEAAVAGTLQDNVV